MSYNSELVIQCGIGNEINHNSDNRNSDNSHNNRHVATISHNNCEVWQSFCTGKCIEFLQLKEIINPKTFVPTIKVLNKCQFSWTFDGLKDLQRQMKTCQYGTLIVLCFMNVRQEEIPNNFLFYLKNKLMGSFLFSNCDCSSGQGENQFNAGNWCLLLQRVIDKGDRVPDQSPKTFVNACIFSNIKVEKKGIDGNSNGVSKKNQCNEFVPSLCKSVQKNLSIETVNWDFNYRNDGTWLYLGESFATDIAEICINLKILPYISSKMKLKVK